MTEAEIIALLERRYNRVGPAVMRGQTVVREGAHRYSFARHVPAHPGGAAFSTSLIDFLAIDSWQSGGYALHAHEIKISRSDLRRELARPCKAAAWEAIADYFWLVLAVGPRWSDLIEQCPETWGVMYADAASLTLSRPAQQLTPPWHEPGGGISRRTVAAITRSVAKDARRCQTPAVMSDNQPPD